MLNKILISLLIILNIFTFKANSNDQISFDVSEVEILDGGNKIIGSKRGNITTNNGITIEADNFEFDKIKNILVASGEVVIEDKINNYNFITQNILYDKNKERIEITSDVLIIIEKNYEFSAENVVIQRNEKIISSTLLLFRVIINIFIIIKL